MDCFYAAVEIRHNPKLAGLPLAVGGSPQARGVICTASYEARNFGVRSAMSSALALRKCPELLLLPPDFNKYESESRAIHQIFTRFTDVIEPLSLDEAFLDVTECQQLDGSATRIAEEIRRAIKAERKLTASAGVGPNKLLAKVASDWKKPDGLFVIAPEQVDKFMKTLSVRKLFGVGEVTEKKLHSMGLRTCGEVQNISMERLVSFFGTWGRDLYFMARGVDNTPVENDFIRKSLSVEHTFPQDLPDLSSLKEKLPDALEEFNERFAQIRHEYAIKAIQVKVKFNDFKSTTAERATSSQEPTVDQFEKLIEIAYERGKRPVRLIGVGAKLEPIQEWGEQLELWAFSKA